MKNLMSESGLKSTGLVALVATALLPSVQAFGATVRIDTRRAVVAGSFCESRGDTVLRASPGHLAVTFARGKIALPMYRGDGRLSEMQSCRISVPVYVPEGFRVGKATTRLRSQMGKSYESRGVLTTSVTISAASPLQARVSTPTGAFRFGGPLLMYKHFYLNDSEYPGWGESFCDSTSGSSQRLMTITVGAAGQRNDEGEYLSIDFSGPNKGFDVWMDLQSCY